MARHPANTRDRLIEVACAQFAERGFRGTTVARICREAGANIAAVNYHFGGKESLYKEAWRYAHRTMLEVFPPDGGVPPDAPAEERLEGRIRAILQRALSDDGLEFQILSHEAACATGLLGQVIQDTLRPLGEALEGILRELLGGPADERTVRLCVTSVIGPCMQVMWRQRMRTRQGLKPWFGAPALEGLVEHFTAFALAGIRGVRRGIERGGRRARGRRRQRGRS